MNTATILSLLEAQVGPIWHHTKKSSFDKLFAKLPAEIQQRARTVFKTLKDDPNRTDFSPLHQVKGVYRVSLTSNGPAAYRAAAHRNGTTMEWFFIGSHAAYERDVLGKR